MGEYCGERCPLIPDRSKKLLGDTALDVLFPVSSMFRGESASLFDVMSHLGECPNPVIGAENREVPIKTKFLQRNTGRTATRFIVTFTCPLQGEPFDKLKPEQRRAELDMTDNMSLEDQQHMLDMLSGSDGEKDEQANEP